MATISSSISRFTAAPHAAVIAGILMAIAPLTSHAAVINQTIGGLHLQAEGLTIDLAKNQVMLLQVTISEDGYVIKADEAHGSGIDFKHNEWTFIGNVNITTPTGFSTADQAIGKFAQNEITELHITGSPATFKESRPDLQYVAEGRANRVDYDLNKQQMRLTGNVLLKHRQLETNQQAKYKGEVEYKGQTLLYDMAKQMVSANKEEQQGQQLQMTVTPDNESEASSTGGASKNNRGAAKP